MKNIKRLRKALGLTQAEFAKSLSVSRTTITMWETENREPDYTMLRHIAEKYDISTDFLIGCGLFSEWEQIMARRKDILEAAAVIFPEYAKLFSITDDELYLVRIFGILFKWIVIDGNEIHLFPTIPFQTENT